MRGKYTICLLLAGFFMSGAFMAGCERDMDNEPPPAQVMTPPKGEDKGTKEHAEEKYEYKKEMNERSKNLEDL